MPDTSRPNFVIMLADDQGFGDVGYNGGDDLQTPAQDRLAREGARCSQWYSGAPLCSPSRACLMTGLVPPQAGVARNIPAANDAVGLRRDVQTLPEALRDAGYQTLMSGKWHLGQAPGSLPHERGFDDWFGFLHGCIDYYSHIFYWLMAGGKGDAPRHDLWDNGREVFANGRYVMDLIVDRAIAQLQRAKDDGRPFLLYVPMNAPHYPMHAPPEAMQRFAHLDEARQLTAALVWVFDQAVGRILDELDRLGLADNTCLFVSSDHGPSRETRNWPDGRNEPFPGGSSGGLRGHKSQFYEGGLRVPAVWRWPGVTTPGSVVEMPLHHQDVMPTLLAAAGTSAKHDIAGLDLQGILAGKSEQRTQPLVWADHKQFAIRQQDWKLIVKPDGEPELFHLADDPAEAHNLASAEPARVDQLKSAFKGSGIASPVSV